MTTADELLYLADVGRWLTLKMLSSLGPMTGRSLSGWTKLDEKDTMLQLRALREIGFVERDSTDKADRHAEWRVRPGDIDATAMAVSDDPREREVAALWGEVTSETRLRMASSWYDDMPNWSERVREHALNWDVILSHLSVDDLKELSEELLQLVTRWQSLSRSRKQQGTNPDPEGLTVMLALDAFPLRKVHSDT